MSKKSITRNILCAASMLLLPVVLELLLHLFVYVNLDARVVYPVLEALSLGVVAITIYMLLPKKAGAIVLCIAMGLAAFYFEVQLIYNSIFGEFMSLWQVSFGADAITNFYRQLFYGMWQIAWQILLLAAPAVALIILFAKGKLYIEKSSYESLVRIPVLLLCLFALLRISSDSITAVNNTNAFSVYRLAHSADTATEISVKNLGLFATTGLEAKYLIKGYPEAEDWLEEAAAEDALEEETTEPAITIEYNELDIDFDALAEETINERIQKLDSYFSRQPATEKNDYTGYLQDYNLICICAESFSNLIIDEELTPALYKLSHEGFLFPNYYGTYGSNTTNGEYTFCMGIYPDMSRAKSAASFYASRDNYLPFALGRMFAERGIDAFAYHNYWGSYYTREKTHPNMGYDFKSPSNGLDITVSWPSSDLDMFKASVDDYLSKDRFCAYYMTFSGHYQYNWENPMCAKNRKMVANLDYTDPVKCYVSCNLELEYALAYLLEQLELTGHDQDTCIVLTNDHYPYGLNAAQYNELAGREIDTTFEKYKNSFICYVPGKSIMIDKYCSTVDILPTLLNLFGFDYDSRLLAGKDILSPQASNMAVLSDQSFVTKDYAFDASTGKITVFKADPASADLARAQKEISEKFSFSTDILVTDYYRHVFRVEKD